MRFPFILLGFCVHLTTLAQRDAYSNIQTNYGAIVIRLYKETPVHQANFIKLAKAHYFDTTLFHRVIKNFVIQGGDPDSLFTTPADTNVLKQQRLMPEYREALFHKRGAFGAGRDDNPLEASFYSQFYIVQGRSWTDSELEEQEKRMGHSILPSRKTVYKQQGGLPRLDDHYTIFGEVVKGMEVVNHIAELPTIKDAPVVPVTIRVTILSKKAVKRLLRLH